MAFKLKPIKPKGNAINFAAIERAVKGGMDEAKDAALEDYEACTADWEHQVDFIAIQVKDGWIVGTEDEIFQFVDEGTDPHQIAPKPGKTLRFYAGGAPKTRPHIIGSGPGKRGDRLVHTRKPVQHPGTEAREFTQEIHKKWDRELPFLIQGRIDRVVGSD
jgi:hypothetical protein